MSLALIATVICLTSVGSLIFSTLTYSLRELSRARLSDYLDRHGLLAWLDRTMSNLIDLVFVTAVLRMIFNTALLLECLWLGDLLFQSNAARYGFAGALGTVLTLICSIVIADVLTRHAGAAFVGMSVRLLHALRLLLTPVTRLLHLADAIAKRAVGLTDQEATDQIEQEIQQEILSVVEEGEKEGVVDEEEREMIESVIHLRDTTCGQVMTPRPEIVAVDVKTTLTHLKATLEESGHSRLPVYDGTLDQIVGILYARDLLVYLGQPTEKFNIRSAIRPAIFVPETKPLRDLLDDFRLQKIHIAVVSDEYGGTSGLVTIEDILEELVGDISDEHEPIEPAMFEQRDDHTAEADARIYIDEVNRLLGLNLPEDAGYDTLGGFISTTLGRIPDTGTTFEHNGARFTVLDAEPQKVNRVKIELIPETAGTAAEPRLGG